MIKKVLSAINYFQQAQISRKSKMLFFRAYLKILLAKSLLRSRNEHVKVKLMNRVFYSFDFNTLSYLFEEIFVSNDYYVRLISDNPIIIDCGSNTGIAMLYFKAIYPKSKILCFEPNPRAVEVLKKNIKRNSLEDVFLHEVPLSNKEEEMKFYYSENINSLTSSIFEERGGANSVLLQTKKLSNYITERIDLVKIDVEGAEIQIISDLISSRKIDLIDEMIVEFHHNLDEQIVQLHDFLGMISKCGFKYKVKSSYSLDTDFQDIMIHFFR